MRPINTDFRTGKPVNTARDRTGHVTSSTITVRESRSESRIVCWQGNNVERLRFEQRELRNLIQLYDGTHLAFLIKCHDYHCSAIFIYNSCFFQKIFFTILQTYTIYNTLALGTL